MPAGAGARVSDDPEGAAAAESVGMALACGNGASGPGRLPAVYAGPIRGVYERLKNAVEPSGVFVAQSSFPHEDARGFATTGDGPPVTLINSSGAIKSRMLTLFHEYAHALLDGGSLRRPDPESLGTSPRGGGAAVEKWCDDSASSILMPRPEFLEALGIPRGAGAFGRAATPPSRRFRMAGRAVLARAVGLLDGADRRDCLDSYGQIRPGPPAAGGGRRPAPAAACLDRLGGKYVKTVVDLEDAGLVTEPDMCMYLDLEARHFDELREPV